MKTRLITPGRSEAAATRAPSMKRLGADRTEEGSRRYGANITATKAVTDIARR